MGVQYNTIENVPVASFETSWKNESANQPIKSVVAEITPTQDLHGYDYPWPAGGGKNICPPDGWEQGQIQTDGTVNSASYAVSSPYILLAGGQTYTLSRNYPDYGDGQMAYHTYDLSKTHLSDSSWEPNNYAFTPESDCYIRITTMAKHPDQNPPALTPNDVGTMFVVQLERGSTATTFTPYSNICPITGRTEATVTRAGKNLFDYTRLQSGDGLTVTISQTGTVSISGLPTQETVFLCRYDITDLLQDGTYTLSQSQFFGAQLYSEVLSRNKDGTISYYGCANVLSKNIPVDKSLVDAYEIYVVAKKSTWGEESKTLSCTFQLEKGSTATSFAPYSGTTIPVTWRAEAGTVYGGTVDVVSGVLTVTHATRTFDGTENWKSPDSSGICWFRDDTLKKTSNYEGTIIASTMPTAMTRHRLRVDFECGISGYEWSGADNYWYIKAPNQTTQTNVALKAWLQANNVQVCYALATPQTYQLSGQQIKTLLGLNNVWADSGNIKKLMWQYTIFDLLRVFINGFEITDFIAFGGWQRERGDVDGPEAGRTLDARMHRARVATKMRYNVTCRPLLVEELSSLERLIMPEYVTVKVVGDPYYGTWEKTCYVNNTSSQYLIRKRNGAQWWGGITFPIIEV